MGYVKVVKNKQYYKRYQVKFRRRREHKTNYHLRRKLVMQDKRKYNTPKWRLIVRVTNKDIICQVASAKMIGDQVICAAYAHELKRYGLKVGFTNYAACYCTGLLLARRLLKKMGLDKFYPGKKKLDGRSFISREQNVNWGDERIRRPFRCILDIGVKRATTGARIFGVLKGAVDGGLNVPHSNRRFPGYTKTKEAEGKDEYNADAHRAKIFGQHIADYMKSMEEKDLEKYNKHFSQFVKEGIKSDNLEEMYKKVHSAIRKDPAPAPKKKRDWKQMKIRVRQKKLTLEEKRATRKQRIEELQQKYAATAEQQQQQRQQQGQVEVDGAND